MTDQPTEPDVFDLDALEREGDAAGKPPFRFSLDGTQYVLVDATDIDYRDLLTAFNAANSADFETALSLLMPASQREDFFEHEIPLWKMEKLFDRYTKHFGLAPGKSKRSPRS